MYTVEYAKKQKTRPMTIRDAKILQESGESFVLRHNSCEYAVVKINSIYRRASRMMMHCELDDHLVECWEFPISKCRIREGTTEIIELV